MDSAYYPFPYPKSPAEKWPMLAAIGFVLLLFILLFHTEWRSAKKNPFTNYIAAHSPSAEASAALLDETKRREDTKK